MTKNENYQAYKGNPNPTPGKDRNYTRKGLALVRASMRPTTKKPVYGLDGPDEPDYWETEPFIVARGYIIETVQRSTITTVGAIRRGLVQIAPGSEHHLRSALLTLVEEGVIDYDPERPAPQLVMQKGLKVTKKHFERLWA